MNIAKDILAVHKLWEEMDKNALIDNLRSLVYHDVGNSVYVNHYKRLMEITGSTRNAVEAWMNYGRPNVGVPFLKTCMIAAHYNVDIYRLLKVHQCTHQDKDMRFDYLYNEITK